MTNDVTVMDSLPAAKIQMFENDSRFHSKRVYELHRRARRFDKRIERSNLGTNMHVDAHHFERRMLRSINKCFARIGHIDPKFVFLHSGRNVGMAFRIDIGIDTNGNFGSNTETFRNPIDDGKLFQTLDIEGMDIGFERKFNLGIGFAGAIERDLLRDGIRHASAARSSPALTTSAPEPSSARITKNL